jgi:hypothetical protein
MNRSDERKQFLADILTTAIEGGINYWSRTLKYKWKDTPTEPTAVIRDEDGSKYDLSIETVAKGIGLIVRGEVHLNTAMVESIKRANRENEAADLDAWDADAIIQAAVLGELVYG